MDHMRRSENMNMYVHRGIAKAFRGAAAQYDGRIGLCASAALLMFLESDPKIQGEYISRVFQLDLKDQVEDALREVKEEQARRVEEREHSAAGKLSGTRKREAK
jgi:DNA repair exonuclease SbcCD ATPase subunit